MKSDNFLKIDEKEILICLAGKFNFIKKTKLVLDSIKEIKHFSATLVLVGSFDNQINLNKYLGHPKIKYLGWKSMDALREILVASDIYLQPGSQSIIMQEAACMRNALVLYPHVNYKNIFSDDDVFYVENSDQLKYFLHHEVKNYESINTKREASYQVAKIKLDNHKNFSEIFN
mgnify:CR=1 FL=1